MFLSFQKLILVCIFNKILSFIKINNSYKISKLRNNINNQINNEINNTNQTQITQTKHKNEKYSFPKYTKYVTNKKIFIKTPFMKDKYKPDNCNLDI